jgi:hypothetical protein
MGTLLKVFSKVKLTDSSVRFLCWGYIFMATDDFKAEDSRIASDCIVDWATAITSSMTSFSLSFIALKVLLEVLLVLDMANCPNLSFYSYLSGQVIFWDSVEPMTFN